VDQHAGPVGPKSPCTTAVRLAANLAIDRRRSTRPSRLGTRGLTYSIIPSTFDFYCSLLLCVRFAQAKKLLSEAGYPKRLRRGRIISGRRVANVRSVANYLQQVGIRSKLRPGGTRDALSSYGDKNTRISVHRERRLRQHGARLEPSSWPAASTSTAAIRTSTRSSRTGRRAGPKKRETLLHKIQQLVHEKTMHSRSGSSVINARPRVRVRPRPHPGHASRRPTRT